MVPRQSRMRKIPNMYFLRVSFFKKISSFVTKNFDKGNFQPTVKISNGTGGESVTVTRASLIKFLEGNATGKGTTIGEKQISDMVKNSLTDKNLLTGGSKETTSITLTELQNKLAAAAKKTIDDHKAATGGRYIDTSMHNEI